MVQTSDVGIVEEPAPVGLEALEQPNGVIAVGVTDDDHAQLARHHASPMLTRFHWSWQRERALTAPERG